MNVTLRDLAQAVGISVGNLVYHYKNKTVIIETLYLQLVDDRNNILSGVQSIHSISYVNEQILPLLELYQKYRFIYLDLVEILRAFPKIEEKHREHVESQIAYIKAMLDYSVGCGNLRVEPHEGFYQRLSHTIWMILAFWLNQQVIRGRQELDFEEARQSMWNLIIPYLTDKGKARFSKIYLHLLDEINNS